MKRSTIILVHVVYWMLYFFILGTLLYFAKPDDESFRNAELFDLVKWTLVSTFINFYFFYLFLGPRFLGNEKYLQFIGFGFMSSLFTAFIPTVIVYFSLYYWGFYADAALFFGVFVAFSFFTFLSGIMATLIRITVNWFADIQVKQKLELALLKSRFDPHFLFNTLNNIDVLIARDAQTASAYLKKLSDLLRFMLHEEHIPLEKEVDYIEKYIELQRIRTSNEQYIKLDITGDASGFIIAPMLLIPFMENAFKHVTGKKMNNAISIQLVIKEKEIDLTCSNVFDPARPPLEGNHGLGLSMIRQRLELLYKDQHDLKIDMKDDIFSVHCIIRLNRNELHHH